VIRGGTQLRRIGEKPDIRPRMTIPTVWAGIHEVGGGYWGGVCVKAAMYSVQRFERKAFDNANRDGMHEIVYITAPLDETTVPLAEGCTAVIPSLNDPVGAATLQLLAERATERGLQHPGPCRCRPSGVQGRLRARLHAACGG